MSGIDTKNIDAKLVEMFREAAELAHERIPPYFSEKCESPIERLFLCALWARGVWVGDVAFVREHTLDDVSRCVAGRPMHIVAAPQVRIGRHRVDFLLVGPRVDGDPTCRVVVECDGHEFHEKTKAQAARDKARDREMQASGIQVFRFAGSEIWRDAGECAAEVILHVITECADSMYRSIERRRKQGGDA